MGKEKSSGAQGGQRRNEKRIFPKDFPNPLQRVLSPFGKGKMEGCAADNWRIIPEITKNSGGARNETGNGAGRVRRSGRDSRARLEFQTLWKQKKDPGGSRSTKKILVLLDEPNPARRSSWRRGWS